MKKRLLSAFLAVMMVLTMAPMAFAAGTGDDVANGDTAALDKLLANVDADHPLTEVSEDVWPAATPVYYNGNFYKTIDELLYDAQQKKGVITPETAGDTAVIYCRPGATLAVGTTSHASYVTSTTIYGNGATLSAAHEWDVENYYTLTKDITINLYNLNGGAAVWSTRKSDNTVTVNMKNCKDAHEVLFNYESGNGKVIANIEDCTFLKNGGAAHGWPVSINCVGSLTVKDCTFDGVTTGIAVNVKQPAEDGQMTVDVENCEFKDVTGQEQNKGALRVTGEKDCTIDFTAKDVSFTGTHADPEDITIGNASAEKNKGVVNYNISNTAASLGVNNIGAAKTTSELSADTIYTGANVKWVAEVNGTKYPTVAAAIAAAQDNATVTLLKDVALDSTLTVDKNITLDLNGCEISNGSAMKQDYLIAIAAGKKVSLVGNKENSKISDSRSNDQGTITTVVVHGTLTIESDNLTISRGANGIAVKVEEDPGTLIMNSGTITVDKPTITSSQAVQNWGNTTINGGIFNGAVDSYAYISGTNHAGNMTIINGTFNGEVFAAQLKYNGNWPTASAKVSVTGGNIKGKVSEYYHDSTNGLQPVEKVNKPENAAESEVTVSGGYFTTDPSEYCVAGKTGVLNTDTATKDTYSWTVGDKIEDAKPAEVAAATVAATAEGDSQAAKDAAKEINGATLSQNEAIKAATKNEANKNTIEATTKVDGDKTVTEKLNEKLPEGSKVTDTDVKIVYQTYIDVAVKDAKAENNTFTELTVELTPMYRVIAANKNVTNYKVDVDTTEAVNAVQIVGEKKLENLTGKYEVTLQLPNGFVVPSDSKLSIKHEKSSGVEYYTGTASATTSTTKQVTFVTNGFSPYTVYSNVAAYIDDTAYPTLQAAADAANSSDTIVVKSGASHDLTFTTNKSVKVKNDTGAEITVKFNGTDKKVGNGETETFTYSKPSSSGSSGGSSSGSGSNTFSVTTSAVDNGGVNASPSKAAKGKTVTITLSPDKGYKLDKLTVTDGSGKAISTTKKSDTVYTFTMPASQVKVGVSYVKIASEPEQTTGYADVAANDWFADAVQYVSDKGMMNGTGKNTFGPQLTTTRGMIVTVLYRLEKEPQASAASFTDVASGEYYANAVAWANANGIVSGYGNGKFGPNDTITREQLAAILYRYAQFKKYDVSVGEDTNILSYTDAQSVSSYAVPAMQWACGAGVVTGKTGGKLAPKGSATRAEVATMLMRFCENVK